MDRTLKVIVLYNKLFHYRIPIWNILAQKCDLTVAYSFGNGDIPTDMPCNFKVLHLPANIYLGKIVIQKTNVRKLVKNYDAVIAYGNIAWLKYSTLPWFGNNKVIFHTIGVSASYEKKFDEDSTWDGITSFFYKRASAIVFYTDYPISKFKKLGIDGSKMFVAPNTVAVSPILKDNKKNTILFIGTIYRQKGLMNLCEVYQNLRSEISLPILNIVGNGPDFQYVKEWVEKNNLTELIRLLGPIYQISEKALLFSKALACISPCQAGLSVLESMGYGVPYVTSKDAYTGGELLNIRNEENGVLMESLEDLPVVIRDIALNPNKYIIMGNKAKAYYDECRKPEDMAEGLWQSVLYAVNH